MQIIIDDRIVNKTFRKHKEKTPELMRLYYLCNQSFYKRSGLFTLDELADLLADQGYKSLRKNQGGNRQKKIKELWELLQTAPELFIQSNDNIFRTVSKHRIHRLKTSERVIDDSLLHKKNKREFYDLIIGIPGSDKTVDYETLKQCTGYTTARICQATNGNHAKGHILKINNELILSEHDNADEALTARLKLYKDYGKITHVVPKKVAIRNRFNPTKTTYKTIYQICLYAANSYTSKVMLSPESAKLQPILSMLPGSKYFEVMKLIKKVVKNGTDKFKTFSYMSDEGLNAFGWRHSC